jgi:tetratricopeptide (TPR) repeat protein
MHGIARKNDLAWRVMSRVHHGSGAHEEMGIHVSAGVAVGLLLALGACTSNTNYTAEAPGKSKAALQADADACNRVIADMRAKDAFSDLNPYFVQCMTDRGDTVRRTSPPVQAASGNPPVESGLYPRPQANADICSRPDPYGVWDQCLKEYGRIFPETQALSLWQDYRKAKADDKAGNYTEALPLWQKFEAQASDPEGLAFARSGIGKYYLSGYAVQQNYTEAARWYQKAVDTRDTHGGETGIGRAAKHSLGLLYAYGLGVPRDRAKARQIWVSMGGGTPNADDLVKLLDNNALPRTYISSTFRQEEDEALAALNAKEARQRQEEEAAEQERIARAPRSNGSTSSPSGSPPSIPGPSVSFCNKFTTGSFVSGALGNPWCD